MHFFIEYDLGTAAMSYTVFAGSRSAHGAAFSTQRVSELCDVARVSSACVSMLEHSVLLLQGQRAEALKVGLGHRR